jgi:beta-phosphoglucomutase-like phosphatase (HAD superfamily)
MSKIKAVFFDQDGVIIDTERDGHRVSFNMTFKEFGFTYETSLEDQRFFQTIDRRRN